MTKSKVHVVYDPYKKPWVKGYRPAQWKDRPKWMVNFAQQSQAADRIMQADYGEIEKRVLAHVGWDLAAGPDYSRTFEVKKEDLLAQKDQQPQKYHGRTADIIIMDDISLIDKPADWKKWYLMDLQPLRPEVRTTGWMKYVDLGKQIHGTVTGRLLPKESYDPNHPHHEPIRSKDFAEAVDRANKAIHSKLVRQLFLRHII